MPKSLLKYHAEAWDILQHLFKTEKINDRTIHFAATFSGNLDLNRLKKSVDLSADAFPLIRCGFRMNDGRPYWEDKGDTPGGMVEFLETEEADGGVWEFLQREADEICGPQLKIRVIRRGGTDTLCAAINHMICDAAGFKEYLYLLASIYTRLEKDPGFRPKSAMGKRDIGQIMKSFSFFDKVKIFAGSDNMTKHDAAKFDFEGDLDHPFIEMRRIPCEKLRLLKEYAKGSGATVNDVLLAAYLRTLYHHFGHAVAVPCAVDLRKYLPNRRAGSICNLVTNLTCDIGSDIGETFSATLEKVMREMKRQKGEISCMKSISLMETVLRILPFSTAKKLIGRNFANPPIALSNLGILDKERLDFGQAKMTDAFMTGSIKYAPYFQLAVSTFDEVTAFSVNLYGTQNDRDKISRFLDEMVWELYRSAETKAE